MDPVESGTQPPVPGREQSLEVGHGDETQNTEDVSVRGLVDEADQYVHSVETDKPEEGNAANDRDKEGLNSDDNSDGFRKWFTGCVSDKSKLLDEDKESYGFTDIRTKRPEVKSETSNTPKHDKRTLNAKRQNSYKEAVNTNSEITLLNNSIPVSNESHRVPINPSVHNKLQPNTEVNSSRSTVSYPCQTNAQCHPSTKFRKKHEPIVNPDVYNFTYPERGYLINIVNDHFMHQQKREGAHWDLLKMKEIGRKFGFRLFNYNNDRNLTRNQTLSLLTEIQRADHSNCDSFMFMISTHGLEQRNPAAGGQLDHALVCADDQLIFTSTILKMFNDKNCPTLKGKPKIFFIQACRGERLDHGSDVFVVFPTRVDRADRTIIHDNRGGRRSKKESVDEYDTKHGQDSWAQGHGVSDVQYNNPGESMNPYGNRQTYGAHSYTTHRASPYQPEFIAPKYPQYNPSAAIRNNYTIAKVPFNPQGGANKPRPFPVNDTPSLRCSNDMLVMYAIPQGMFAWRSQADGSWMIDYLHQILMSYNMTAPKNFLTLLTKVAAVMSRRETHTPSMPELHQKKAIPVIEHKLDKDIIFQPKIKGSSWVRQFQQMSL